MNDCVVRTRRNAAALQNLVLKPAALASGVCVQETNQERDVSVTSLMSFEDRSSKRQETFNVIQHEEARRTHGYECNEFDEFRR